MDAGGASSLPAGAGRYWKLKDPDAYTGSADDLLRIAAAPTEAAVRAVGMACYAFGVFFLLEMVGCVCYAVLHAKGNVLAPWSVSPIFLAMDGLGLLAGLAAFAAGHGLRRLRPWAPGAAVAMTAAFFGLSLLSSGRTIQLGRWDSLVFMLVCQAIVLAPMLVLLLKDVQTLLGPVYAGVVERTPHIKVRSRLHDSIRWPFWILVALFFLLTFVTS